MDIKQEFIKIAADLSKVKTKEEDKLWKLSNVPACVNFLSKTRQDVEFNPTNLSIVTEKVKEGKLAEIGIKKQGITSVVRYLEAALDYLKKFERTSTSKIQNVDKLIKELIVSKCR